MTREELYQKHAGLIAATACIMSAVRNAEAAMRESDDSERWTHEDFIPSVERIFAVCEERAGNGTLEPKP